MSEAEAVITPLLSPAGGVPEIIESDAALKSAIEKLAAGSGPIAVDAERASGFPRSS
jgi:ribonuclease D